MTASKRRLAFASDRGVTLTELLVYVVLLGVVMTIVTSVFISINTAQKTVTSVVGASNQGQVAADQLSTALNNAANVFVYSPKLGDQILLTRTALAGATATWVCEAWYYQAAANASDGVGNIRFTTSTAAIPAPSNATLATWAVVASGVTPVSGSNIFVAPNFTSTVAITTFSFYVTGAGQKPQLITSSVTTPLGTIGSSPCF